MIHLHQTAEAENPGKLSFALLLSLIQQSSNKPNDPNNEAVISITYEDHEGEEVLIGSSEELQYAFQTQGDQDVLKLKVKILQGKTGPKSSTNNQEHIHMLENITQHLVDMEARIHQKISLAVNEVEGRLLAKLDTIERTLATTERVIVSAATVACERKEGDDAMDIMEQGIAAPPAPVRVPLPPGRSLSVELGKSKTGIVPTAVVEPDTLATAECHWATTTTTTTTQVEAGVDVSSSEVVMDTSEDGQFTDERPNKTERPDIEPTAGVPLSINNTKKKEKEKETTVKDTPSAGVDEESVCVDDEESVFVDVEQLVSTVLSKEVLPLLNKCLKRVSYYEEKRGRGFADLKEDLRAQSSKLEEWNRTVLDGMSVQSTVLKARMNDRADRVVRRISSLEAFCRDLSNKNILLKQGQTIQKIEAEQTILRNDIKTLLQAIMREGGSEEEEDDAANVQSSSDSSESSSERRFF
jgi:hypothetical protein